MIAVNSQSLAGKILPRDLRDDRKIKHLIIHRQSQKDGTPWSSVEKFAEWIKNPSNKWGTRLFPYHYYLEPDGTIHNVLPITCKGQHAYGFNSNSIGIALALDGRKHPPTPKQWESLQKLCQILLRLYPNVDIRGHSKVKRCPGRFVDIKRLAKEAKSVSGKCPTCGRARGS